MKRGKLRRGACFLLLVGLLAAVVSTGFLCSIPDTLQYAVAAPNGETDLKQALAAKKETAEQLADCTHAIAVGAITEKASVSAGEMNESAMVYAVGEGWFEIYPVFMREGRRLTETELRQGDSVALLDEKLAFLLFGSELPSDASVDIDETEYRVVGTIRHSQSVGESMEHCVYVPLTSAPKARRDVLMTAAKPIANSGAQTMFESAMRSAWRSDGCFYSVKKEALRQMMLPRILLGLFGLSAVMALMRRMNRLFSKKVERYREKLRWNYFKDTLPVLLGMIVVCLLGYAVILTMLYALIAFSVQPLTVFTEWVPENFVKWSSLKNVFWNLTNSAAKLVKVGTREMRRLEFWGRILRWGTISVLSGVLLARRGKDVC